MRQQTRELALASVLGALAVLFLALLLLCIALMMNDTYSTFLYFQF